MPTHWRIHRWSLIFLMILLAAAGCARSPEAKKARFLDRGDRYFKKEQYREAIIEYRNALRFEGTNARAIQQIGLAHYQLGEFGQAARFLLKAQELTPDQLEVRVKLGTLYFLGRRFKETQDEATYVLAKDPNNLDALLLLVGAAVTPEDVEAALPRLEGARVALGDPPRLRIALANLQLRKRNVAAAEALLQETVQKDPKSIEAHTALADLYLLKQDRASAEREFQAAAAAAPAGSPARIRLADYYVLGRRPDEARKVLGEVTAKAPDYLPAWRRLGEIALTEGKLEDADKALERVLKKNPQDLDGHLLKGRVFLARKNSTQAVQEFQQVLKLEPGLAAARYQLALAHLQGGNVQQAKTELKEATTVSPNYVEAQLRLAQLNLETGAVDPAIEDLTRLLAAQPRLVEGYVLLGAAHLMKKEPAKALEVYRKLAATAPNDPRGPSFVGIGLLATGKRDEARKSFEDALTRAPGYAEPLVQLVRLDLAEKKPEAAVARVQRQIAAVPTSGPLQHLLGKIQEARKEPALAEAAYLKAIELEPRLTGAYVDLARLYGASGRYDQALAKTEEALKRNPGNLGALMLAGTLQEGKGDTAKAEAAYAKALEVNPRFAPAANNLAYLLGERGVDMERALQLAQTAREVAPEEPHIADTLGWLFYKRGIYQRSVALLKESAGRLPDNPVIQYHLGMAAAKAGDRETARTALTSAVKSSQEFPGKQEAQRLLAEFR
jgi:tetratricopeptide (TPR) repeat protein